MNYLFTPTTDKMLSPSTDKYYHMMKHMGIPVQDFIDRKMLNDRQPIPVGMTDKSKFDLMKENVIISTEQGLKMKFKICKTENNLYFHNIRINDLTHLKYATLHIPQSIEEDLKSERIYKDNIEYLNKLHDNTESQVVPFSLTTGNGFYIPETYDNFIIELEFNANVYCELTVDLYKPKIENKYNLYPLFYPISFTGTESTETQLSVVRLCALNITSLQIVCLDAKNQPILNKCIESFIFRSDYMNELVYKNPDIENGYYMINLTSDKAEYALDVKNHNVDMIFKFNTDQVKMVNIYGINKFGNIPIRMEKDESPSRHVCYYGQVLRGQCFVM
jgi:hypothetical protein